MYGWNDPIDPDGAARRPEPAADEPAWLTDRPEPRSAYLFGDEPDRPADEWHREQPTARWQPEPGYGQHAPAADAYRDQPAQHWEPAPAWPHQEATEHWRDAEPAWQHQEPTEHWHREEPGGWRGEATAHGAANAGGWQEPTGGWRHDETAGWAGTATGAYADEPVTHPMPAAHLTAPADAGNRPNRRLKRPVLIGGAAAAATLVVSLGIGAVALSGGDDATPTSAVDDTVATAPALPEGGEAPAELLDPTSPSAAPTSAKPSPSATPSRKPSPAASRSTATARRNQAPRTTAPATGGATAPSGGGSVSAQAREVVNLVNAERAKAGCGALSIDDKLMTAAQRHSQDQADHQNMSHTGSDGSDPGDRINRVGYQWRTYGENVAWNQKTPAAVMDAWMNSSGHRANILNCAFTEIGVGIASSNGPYWTQVFAAPR
ncbi:CAP domain-containing protein [Micromonospora sp. NPDC126480]|uniref:CAP domain-containing protein n=1 Tax=Micromonospora sp. NPDC126480 TaxID=3155312 RepID=UPI00332EE1BD